MADSYDDVTSRFIQWLQHKGIKISPKMRLVDMRSEGRGRGATAIEDIEEDEVIFSIPRDAVINVRNNLPLSGSVTSAGLTAQDIEDMPPWLSLTLLLMLESTQPESPWTPYFSVLPPHLDSLVFWTDAERAELQASAVVNKLGRSEADHHYNTTIAPLNIPGGEQLFHHMASLIMAYAFDIPEHKVENKDEEEEELQEDDEETVLTMIPLADMLNADADRNNARLMCDSDELEMRAIKPILRGDEILNDYGQLPRSDLLRRYGYITDNYIKYDVTEISAQLIIETLKAQPLGQGVEIDPRVQVAEREGVYEEAYDLTHADDEEDQACIPDELLAFIWILCVDNDTFKALQLSESSMPSSRHKLATQYVGEICSAVLRARIAQYPTNIAEDEATLHSGQLGHRQLMAVQVRLGEKQILLEAMEEAVLMRGENKRMRCAEPYTLQSGKRGRDENKSTPQSKKRKN